MRHTWDMLRYLRLEGDLKSNVHFQPAGWLSHIDALKMSGVLTHRECIRPPPNIKDVVVIPPTASWDMIRSLLKLLECSGIGSDGFLLGPRVRWKACLPATHSQLFGLRRLNRVLCVRLIPRRLNKQ